MDARKVLVSVSWADPNLCVSVPTLQPLDSGLGEIKKGCWADAAAAEGQQARPWPKMSWLSVTLC